KPIRSRPRPICPMWTRGRIRTARTNRTGPGGDNLPPFPRPSPHGSCKCFRDRPGLSGQPPPRIRKPPMSLLAQPFDAVIFDMDGTLLDTEAVFKAIVYEVCTELGFAMTDQVHGRMVGSSHEA